MAGADARIGQALVQSGLIDELQLRSAQAHYAKWGGHLSRIVVDLGFAREDRVADALAAAFGAPRVKLATIQIDRAALARLDAAFCEQRGVFPCALRDNGKLLYVAVDDPTDLELLDGIGLRADVPRVKPVVAGHDEINVAILRHYRGESILEKHRGASSGEGGIEIGDATDEVEITDPGGKVIKNDMTPALGLGNGLNAAQAQLEELLGGDASLTPDEERRLLTAKESQERGLRILRALVSLCTEKGIFLLDEFRSRVKR